MKWKVRGNHVYNENDMPLLVATYGLMKPEEKHEALQLAAAAPELLEALEGLTEELEKIEAWDGDCPWLIPFVRQARAVIKKARWQGGER